MKRGGYQIVDLQDAAITLDGASVTIPGVHEAVSGANRKPTLVSGITVTAGGDTSKMADSYVDFVPNGTSYEAVLYGMALTVTEADAVTLETIA